MISFNFKSNSGLEYNSLLDFGIYLVNKPALPRANRVIKYTEAEGRDGALTYDTGTYEDVGIKLDCLILDENLVNNKMEQLNSWLNGESGELSFSFYPNKFFIVKEVRGFSITESYGILGEFQVSFICKPFKYKRNDFNIFKLCEVSVNRNSLALNPLQLYNFTSGTVFSANEVVEINKNTEFTYVNSGTMESEPRLELVGTGDVTLSINGRSFSVLGLNGKIIIDTELEDAYNDTELLNNKMVGEFPYFDIGENLINYSGKLTSFEITPNTKFI